MGKEKVCEWIGERVVEGVVWCCEEVYVSNFREIIVFIVDGVLF